MHAKPGSTRYTLEKACDGNKRQRYPEAKRKQKIAKVDSPTKIVATLFSKSKTQRSDKPRGKTEKKKGEDT